MNYLELLSPAKNAEQGIAAINHGADAVYIGAPLFGARTAAGNSVEDIEQLVNYAHLYHAKVFVTINTLLFDHELEDANRLIHQLYNIGVDAIIMQDMGLLETDLPPIELHASTQTHNYDLDRIKFLEQVGFRRIILARETSLAQMQEIRRATTVELESFVQGALCVSFSGQCYLSQYLNNRSGNRGCCSQPCRSNYDLLAKQGNGAMTLLRKNEHLLSLKDFNASQHLEEMVNAGITSFKIEGRLKDLSYVKNITAYYRNLLDTLMSGHGDCRPASEGRTTFFFEPDLERTFNRSFTDYCLTMKEKNAGKPQEGRQRMASFATQKSMGKKVGVVTRIEGTSILLKSQDTFTSGDGFCFFNSQNVLDGFNLNQAMPVKSGMVRLLPNRLPQDLKVGTILWRNNDFAFEKQLSGRTSERKLPITLTFTNLPNGCSLVATDEQGHCGTAEISCETEPAKNPERAVAMVTDQLCKLGSTPYMILDKENDITLVGEPMHFPSSLINELRRNAIDALTQERLKAYRPKDTLLEKNDAPYPTPTLDYRANIINGKSAAFYQHHGVSEFEYGVEKSLDYSGKALMTTKYCLRYELGMCLMHPKTQNRSELYLRNNKHLLQLHFDCRNCQMTLTEADSQQ